MNLCFVIGTLSYSGAEKIMYHLLQELQNRGHSVSVILISCYKKFDFLPGIKQYPIDNKEEENIKNRFKRVILREKRIAYVIRNNKFDVLVSFGVKFNLDVAEACMCCNVKLVLCERNDPVFDPSSRILRFRRSLAYRRADGFVFQTEKIKTFFPQSIQNRSVVIPNFIDIRINIENLKVRKRMSFATCARLDDNQKNQSALIQAFAKFHFVHNEYKLEIYGDGPDKEKYETLIKELGMQDYIILHGRVNDPMEHIKYCKFFVFTSKYEGMPNALIEAMSYGMPCIATDCGGGGARELLIDGVNGLLIPYNNENALIEAMGKMCENSELAKRMGHEAYKINDILEKKIIIDRWENYLESFCC